MVVAGRRRSIAFFIALGAGLISVIVLLYIGWVLLRWHTGILLFLGSLLALTIIVGVVLNTTFLVREIRRNEQHDAFINAVTHELKTPVASIRLYLETLQTRPVEEPKRQEFYRTMVEDSDRLLATIEQVLRTGRIGSTSHRRLHMSPHRSERHHRGMPHAYANSAPPAARSAPVPARSGRHRDGRSGRSARRRIEPDRQRRQVFGSAVQVLVETAAVDDKFVSVRVRDQGPGIPKMELKQIFKRFYRVPGPLATRVKGTGLGLYIVRSVAKRHGGRAWAESEGPGRGQHVHLAAPHCENDEMSRS